MDHGRNLFIILLVGIEAIIHNNVTIRPEIIFVIVSLYIRGIYFTIWNEMLNIYNALHILSMNFYQKILTFYLCQYYMLFLIQ